jgi:hypothetical protein
MANLRNVTATAAITGTDEEDFGSDEHGFATKTEQTILHNADLKQLVQTECKWGGECRVLVTLFGKRFDNDDVQINGVADLWEGTSEDTTDHDGHLEFSFIVPKGRTVVDQRRIDNQDEGGDFAIIDSTVINSMFEQ